MNYDLRNAEKVSLEQQQLMTVKFFEYHAEMKALGVEITHIAAEAFELKEA